MNSFMPADILMPKVDDMSKWSVIACDQFTSDPAYWERVRKTTEGSPSTINLILPEAELGTPAEAAHTLLINKTMKEYLDAGLFETYFSSYVYIERTLENGSIRKGLIGMVDLDAYDYKPGSESDIRATENTVVSRIPPRQRVRRNAPIEFPHILMLVDDSGKQLIESVAAKKAVMPLLYDFNLMEGGGHIRGWLVSGETADAFDIALAVYTAGISGKYQDLSGTPMTFAVGDGNHSLATAKSCYEELKAQHPGEDLSNHPARYALVELENIHDDALVFEPIHRVITATDPAKLLAALKTYACTESGFPVKWFSGKEFGTVYLDPSKGQLAVGILQNFLDSYLKDHAGSIDYIHDDDVLMRLSEDNFSIGFLLPAMEKGQLFRSVISDGVLPRKTFSMGHAREKRYYLEGRKIK